MYNRILWLLLLLLASFGLFTGVSTELTPPPLPEPAATPAPDPNAGWQEFDNGIIRFRYPGDWWTLLDNGRQVAVRGETMSFRIDLPAVPASAAEQFTAQDVALVGPLLRQFAQPQIVAMFERAGMTNVRLHEFARSMVGNSAVFLDLAYEATFDLPGEGATFQVSYVVLPYVACPPDAPCLIMFSNPADGSNAPQTWVLVDQIMRTVEITR
jgi:hypothetical protein